jgi:hypothetical protein
MHVFSIAASALCAAYVALAKDTWGPAVSFGPSKSVIYHAITTIQPGRAPIQPKNGFLTLWPGMSNGTGNLIQSTLESHENGRPRCGEKPGEWCIMASVFGKPWGQLDSKQQAVVKGKDKITIEYKLESDQNTWTQYVVSKERNLNIRTNQLIRRVTNAETKAVLSTLATKSGPYMRGYGTGTECQKDCAGTIEEHYYFNTAITFKDPEPGFKLSASQGASFTPPVSEQGGRVWKVAKMTIPAMVKGRAPK